LVLQSHDYLADDVPSPFVRKKMMDSPVPMQIAILQNEIFALRNDFRDARNLRQLL
jgi:hypothetical protein